MESRSPSSSLEDSIIVSNQQINLTTYFEFLIQAYEKLKTDIAALEASFDAMKSEGKTMENTAKYGMPAALAVTSAMVALFYICFFASRTDQGKLGNLERKEFFALLLAASVALSFYFIDPSDRTFRAYDWVSRIPFLKNEKFARMSHEYDVMLDSLKFFKENFSKTYSHNKENIKKMGLIFNNLEQEIEFFRANKASLTINLVKKRLENNVWPVMKQAKYEIKHTKGYPQDLWQQYKVKDPNKDELDDLEAGKRSSPLVVVQKM